MRVWLAMLAAAVVGVATASPSAALVPDLLVAEGLVQADNYACISFCICTVDVQALVAFDLAKGSAELVLVDTEWDFGPPGPAPTPCLISRFAPGSCASTTDGGVECRNSVRCMRLLGDGAFEWYDGLPGSVCWDHESCFGTLGCYPDWPAYRGHLARVM